VVAMYQIVRILLRGMIEPHNEQLHSMSTTIFNIKKLKNRFYLSSYNAIILAQDVMPNQYQVLPKEDQDK
jgi:hypothetical protein